jgi:O-antigen/teichoic acid export membrane protein
VSKSGLHNNIASRLMSGGVWVLLGQATLALSGLAINAMLARLLPPAEFGAYFLALSVSVVGALIAQCGTHLSVVQQVAGALAQGREGEVRQLLKGAGLLALIGLIIVEGIYLSGAGAWLGDRIFHSPGVAGAAILIGVWLALRVGQTFLAQVFRGFHNLKVAALIDGALSSVFLLLLLIGAWLLYEKISLRNALEITIVAFLLSVVIGSVLLQRHWHDLPHAHGLRLRPILRVSMPLFISTTAMAGISEMHLWILGALNSEQQVALYGAAYRLAQLVAIPLYLVNNVISPMVTELFSRRDLVRLERVMRTTATAATIPALVVTVVFVAAAGPILNLLYGSFYIQAGNVLVIMTVAQALNVLTGSPGVLLAMSDRQTVLMRIGLLSSVVGLTVSFALAHSLGAIGTALGLATGIITQNIAMNLHCRRHMGVKTHWVPTEILKLTSRLQSEFAEYYRRGTSRES